MGGLQQVGWRVPNGEARPREPAEFSDTYRWYVVTVLLIVHVVGHVDRQVMNVLVEPIRLEFGLSDTVMGLMTGAAFAVFYATLGLPLALWADRRNRRNLIAAAIAVWSVMTVFCGMAVTAFQLILARIGVAVGEAGSNPASHSLIADLFPLARRATPMAVLAIGPNLGILLGFTVGGLVSASFGWRAAFIAVGAPGLLVSLLVLLTVRESVRGHARRGYLVWRGLSWPSAEMYSPEAGIVFSLSPDSRWLRSLATAQSLG